MFERVRDLFTAKPQFDQKKLRRWKLAARALRGTTFHDPYALSKDEILAIDLRREHSRIREMLLTPNLAALDLATPLSLRLEKRYSHADDIREFDIATQHMASQSLKASCDRAKQLNAALFMLNHPDLRHAIEQIASRL